MKGMGRSLWLSEPGNCGIQSSPAPRATRQLGFCSSWAAACAATTRQTPSRAARNFSRGMAAYILRVYFAAPGRIHLLEEKNMNRWLVVVLLLLASSAFAQDAPVIPFEGSDALKMPKDMYLGEATGVAVNAQGHIFVLNRGNTSGPAYAAAASQLLEFDATGKFVREIGKHLYAWSYGHTVRIDRGGNIWATDKGSDMVIKFSPAGRVLMVFGRKQEASDKETGPLERHNPPLPHEDGRFRQVTDVAFDPAGNAYISDGYINSRVAKVDKNGNWVKSWGTKGAKPAHVTTPPPTPPA